MSLNNVFIHSVGEVTPFLAKSTAGKTKQAETECALILNLKCSKGRGLWNQLVRLSSMTNFFLSSALKDFFLVPLNYWAVLESIS